MQTDKRINYRFSALEMMSDLQFFTTIETNFDGEVVIGQF